MDYIVVGCGISGSIIARELAEKGHKVKIYDRRNHIAGNLFDYKDEYGILVQQYGPHIFHTSDEEVYQYVTKFADWQDFKLVCGAEWDGKYTPSPFNFDTIDIFFETDKAKKIKDAIKVEYPDKKTAPVVELMNHSNEAIREYARFLFDNDYAPYTAKQWGMKAENVNPDVLKRVPVRLNYETGYFSDKYEMMPSASFTDFVKNILNHPNVEIILNEDAKKHISFSKNKILWDNNMVSGKIIFTGPIDELFDCTYGELPYRSLRFEWKHSNENSIQKAPVVAYPKAEGYTRITEFNKLPIQDVKGTTYAVEYPLTYKEGSKMEPYYPVSTEDSEKKVIQYKALAHKIDNLVLCGRLADFKYYNMDQAIKNALSVIKEI